jgi:predicted deacylase
MSNQKLKSRANANLTEVNSLGASSLSRFSLPVVLLLLFAPLASLSAGALETNSAATTKAFLLPGTRFATEFYIIDSGHPGPAVMVVGGVHGNEPAGAQAAESIRQWPIQNGRLIVIPRANVPGLQAKKRLIPEIETNLSNLNRNYPRAGQTNNEARGELAQAIWKIATDNKPDWVIDLHEGYDFHQLNEKSVGSSIICFPLPAGQAAADAMLKMVNNFITNAELKFVMRHMPVDGSLARAAAEHLHVPGMTLETTDKQPMELRVREHEIMVHELLAYLGMIPNEPMENAPQAAEAAQKGSGATPAKIRVALYKGPGTGGQGPPSLIKRLNAGGKSSLTEVSPEEIRAGVLTNYDVVIFAGGSGSKEAEALEEPGRAEVERFVGTGGGYIGICAGAYLATSGYPWSLHIINARTLSPKWERGRATLKMELTHAGAELLGEGETNLAVLYHNGPVVGPAEVSTLPPYEPLAFFRTEVAEHDTPKGIMVNSPAIFAGHFKQGKVICISPHPEQTEGLEYIVPHALEWVAPTAKEVAGSR